MTTVEAGLGKGEHHDLEDTECREQPLDDHELDLICGGFQLIEELVAIKILAVLISDAALRVHSLPRWSRSRLDAGVAAST